MAKTFTQAKPLQKMIFNRQKHFQQWKCATSSLRCVRRCTVFRLSDLRCFTSVRQKLPEKV